MARDPLREITVGSAAADVVGTDGRAIQIAIDALGARGGGTVRVRAGEYLLRDSVRLRPGVALIGDRGGTVLRRGPLAASPLAVDADISECHITPADAGAFEPGMGVCLTDAKHRWAFTQDPYVVTAVEGGVLHLSDFMTEERSANQGGQVVNVFPLILARCAEGAVIDGFICDAAVDDPDGLLRWCRYAIVLLYRCPGAAVRHVVVRNGSGDGIAVGKTSTGAVVEDCEAHDNGCHGIHPGSHSAGAAVRRCHIHHNGADGLYICWGVVGGCFEDNHVHHNGGRGRRSGISIGHKDTDCLIARNHVHDNAGSGINVRAEAEANGAHRGVYRANVIENNGSPPAEGEEPSCGVTVHGVTKDLAFEGNTIRETRRGDARAQRNALWLGEGVAGVRMTGNVIEGHPGEPVVDRSGGDHELQTG